MSVTKIKAYNVRKLIEDNNLMQGDRKLTTHLQHELAIIEGTKGVLVFCTEGVGRILESMDDKYTFELSPAPERDENGNPKTISIFATATVDLSPKQIVAEAEYREVEMKDFIRKFGARLEQNFGIQLAALREIGLDSTAYYQGGR